MFTKAVRSRVTWAAAVVTAALALAPVAAAGVTAPEKSGPAQPSPTPQTHVLKVSKPGGQISGGVFDGSKNLYLEVSGRTGMNDDEFANCADWGGLLTIVMTNYTNAMLNGDEASRDNAQQTLDATVGAIEDDGCVIL